eukprot:TRINITY_DN60764_c0_g1_i1.p2 TRINITY_DN60764_c0_g1~~TRINITY_DN60764_c0_g1_i1.p2  ORF type:complete len:292 (+),score=72.64 TRINITY_DN60764_c0_g1_i1:81-956(+)
MGAEGSKPAAPHWRRQEVRAAAWAARGEEIAALSECMVANGAHKAAERRALQAEQRGMPMRVQRLQREEATTAQTRADHTSHEAVRMYHEAEHACGGRIPERRGDKTPSAVDARKAALLERLRASGRLFGSPPREALRKPPPEPVPKKSAHPALSDEPQWVADLIHTAKVRQVQREEADGRSQLETEHCLGMLRMAQLLRRMRENEAEEVAGRLQVEAEAAEGASALRQQLQRAVAGEKKAAGACNVPSPGHTGHGLSQPPAKPQITRGPRWAPVWMPPPWSWDHRPRAAW